MFPIDKKHLYTTISVIGSTIVAGLTLYVYLKKPTYEQYIQTIFPRIKRAYNKSLGDGFLVPFNVSQEYQKNEQGFEFSIKVVDALVTKPSQLKPTEIDPFLAPFQKGQFVMGINDTHNILVNKYPVNPYHSLVVTKQFVIQSSPMTEDDLYSAYMTLCSTRGFAFFNSHKEAGASVPHKHIQVLPASAFDSAPILRHIQYFVYNHTLQMAIPHYVKLRLLQNCKHSIVIFQQPLLESNVKQILIESYKGLMEKIGCQYDQINELKHNWLMTRDFMMLVVRKQDKYDDICLNGVGFAGSLLVKNQTQFETLKQSKIVDILEALSEPEKDQQQFVQWI